MSEVKYVSTFSERFSELIKGKTVIEAGEMLNISKSTVSAYTTGERSPKTTVLKHIAHCFNVDPLWLMGMDVPKYKVAPSPGSGITEDQQYIIDRVLSLDEASVRSLRAIVDQVLSLRGE